MSLPKENEERGRFWWSEIARMLGLRAEQLRPADRTDWLQKKYWWKWSVAHGLDDVEYRANTEVSDEAPNVIHLETLRDVVEFFVRYERR